VEEHDRTDRRILFTLHGQTASRRYALIHTAENWLLHFTRDQPSPRKPAAPRCRLS
jgi:hypothetical protein